MLTTLRRLVLLVFISTNIFATKHSLEQIYSAQELRKPQAKRSGLINLRTMRSLNFEDDPLKESGIVMPYQNGENNKKKEVTLDLPGVLSGEIFKYLRLKEIINFSLSNKKNRMIEIGQCNILAPINGVLTFLNRHDSWLYDKIRARIKYTGLGLHIDLSGLNLNDQQMDVILKIFINSSVKNKIKSIDLSSNSLVLEDFLANSLNSLPNHIEINFANNHQSNLHKAVIRNENAMVESIIANFPKAAIGISTKNGNSALHVGCAKEFNDENEEKLAINIIKALLKSNPDLLTMQNSDGETALHLAITEGNEMIASFLIKYAVEQGFSLLPLKKRRGVTALHLAAFFGQVDIVSDIIKAQPKLLTYTSTKDKATALHFAIHEGHVQTVQAILNERHYLPKLLEMQTSNGSTALHLAAELEDADILLLLIEAVKNCDAGIFNVTNNDGRTARQLAADSGNEEDFLRALNGDEETLK